MKSTVKKVPMQTPVKMTGSAAGGVGRLEKSAMAGKGGVKKELNK